MEELAWKCSVAFALGAATHYLLSRQLQSDSSSSSSNISPPSPAAAPATATTPLSDVKDAAASTSSASTVPASDTPAEHEGDESDSDDSEWEDMDEQQSWEPHKMVLCVRTDLKMGKGGCALAQCHSIARMMLWYAC